MAATKPLREPVSERFATRQAGSGYAVSKRPRPVVIKEKTLSDRRAASHQKAYRD